MAAPQPTSIPSTPEIVYRTEFAGDTVKRLTGSDFTLDSKELIGLKYDDCILVLFYGENTESAQLVRIWAIVAQQTAGPVFAALNLLNERRVAAAFTRVAGDGTHPFHWAALRSIPFILVYRKGWPVAFYNGSREVQAISDFSLTLACRANYYEPIQLAGSMQAEGRLEMSPYDVYQNVQGAPPKVRTDSTQYVAENPIRGFNPSLPLVPVAAPVTNAASPVEATVPAETPTETTAVPGEVTSPAIALPANSV